MVAALREAAGEYGAYVELAPDVDPLDVTAGRWNGTSFTAPQVAGLVSYLWLLSPDLRSAGVPASTARRAILANARDGILDAYAAALSLDEIGDPTDATHPVRHAILDVIDDEYFDEGDIERLLREYFVVDGSGEITRTPVAPAEADYGRFDLNGDGFTGGDTTGRFDLERAGSTRFGETVYGIVTQTIEGESVSFDERALTDLQILCYYAYSALYEAYGPEGRRSLLEGRCRRPDTLELATSLDYSFAEADTDAGGSDHYADQGSSVAPGTVTLEAHPTAGQNAIDVSASRTVGDSGFSVNGLAGVLIGSVSNDGLASARARITFTLTEPRAFQLTGFLEVTLSASNPDEGQGQAVATLTGVFSASIDVAAGPIIVNRQGILNPGSYVLEVSSDATVPRTGAPIQRGDSVLAEGKARLQLDLGPVPPPGGTSSPTGSATSPSACRTRTC